MMEYLIGEAGASADRSRLESSYLGHGFAICGEDGMSAHTPLNGAHASRGMSTQRNLNNCCQCLAQGRIPYINRRTVHYAACKRGEYAPLLQR